MLRTTGYTYDLNGDLATLTYPSGRMMTYVTDSAGRPSSAEDVANNIFYMQGTCANGITSLGVCYAPQGAIASASVGPARGLDVAQGDDVLQRAAPAEPDSVFQPSWQSNAATI